MTVLFPIANAAPCLLQPRHNRRSGPRGRPRPAPIREHPLAPLFATPGAAPGLRPAPANEPTPVRGASGAGGPCGGAEGRGTGRGMGPGIRKGEAKRDWSGLPRELLEAVARRVAPQDRFCFHPPPPIPFPAHLRPCGMPPSGETPEGGLAPCQRGSGRRGEANTNTVILKTGNSLSSKTPPQYSGHPAARSHFSTSRCP